jgi:16S rRNA processing protein RimM
MDLIAIGRIRTAFGVEGELKFESYSGEHAHLGALDRVWVQARGDSIEFTVESVRENGGEVLMKLSGVDTPESAKRLAGCEVWADRAFAAPLQEDEYYLADLVGCELCAGDRVLGTVIGSWDNGQGDLLEIHCRDGSIRNVPFMAPYIGTVDVRKRRIELLTEWVLE